MVNGDEQSDDMNTMTVNENAIPPQMAEGSILAPRFRCPFDECKRSKKSGLVGAVLDCGLAFGWKVSGCRF